MAGSSPPSPDIHTGAVLAPSEPETGSETYFYCMLVNQCTMQ